MGTHWLTGKSGRGGGAEEGGTDWGCGCGWGDMENVWDIGGGECGSLGISPDLRVLGVLFQELSGRATRPWPSAMLPIFGIGWEFLAQRHHQGWDPLQPKGRMLQDTCFGGKEWWRQVSLGSSHPHLPASGLG